jgi:hypothetical protein
MSRINDNFEETKNSHDDYSSNEDYTNFNATHYSEKYIIPASIFQISSKVHENLYYISEEDMIQIKHFIANGVKNRLRVRKYAKEKNDTEMKRSKKNIPYIYKIDNLVVSTEERKINILSTQPDG